MHELSLCGAIADVAHRRAGGRRVEAIHLQIGQLRQVVPDTLQFCWSMVTEQTSLAGCTLEVERIEALLECGSCGARSGMARQIAFACGACGELDVTVVAGEEFLVTALDLVLP
ncbi:MAG TPA: hydrogenase maturation nickel metallochaperone HypA [Sporichthyaceae bacterium]|jgi:hydrogenase nickel incorporation protein HypA/HybF|nr:hydrogenase maturation nickel metallochaperone HypA [Sporichthyaceae bacterium]